MERTVGLPEELCGTHRARQLSTHGQQAKGPVNIAGRGQSRKWETGNKSHEGVAKLGSGCLP